jgi:hypothetical protein
MTGSPIEINFQDKTIAAPAWQQGAGLARQLCQCSDSVGAYFARQTPV